VNRAVYWTTGEGIKMAGWTDAATRALDCALDADPDAVVYSRALPFASIAAAARVRRRRAFRWIVNINDPLPPDIATAVYQSPPWTNRCVRAGLRAAIPLVDAFTFPCERLRRLQFSEFPAMAERPSLVLPHIARTPMAVPRSSAGGRLALVFCGMLRKADSRPEFAAGLDRLVREGHAVGREIELAFYLRQPNPYAEGLIRSLPVPTRIEFGASPETIDGALGSADVLVDLEAESYGALLLTKIARYIGAAKPIWALCVPGGTTWNLITERRCGYVTALGRPAAVADTLRQIHRDWRLGALGAHVPSRAVVARFSAERQVTDLHALCAVLDGSGRMNVSSPDWP
jgi:hypothetical protein